jgi:hypothetical protein
VPGVGGPDRLLTTKSNQKTLYRQIGRQFEGKRKIPFTATDFEKRHGRHTRREPKAKDAPEHIKANWPDSAWIVELITATGMASGQLRLHHQSAYHSRSPAATDPAALEH